MVGDIKLCDDDAHDCVKAWNSWPSRDDASKLIASDCKCVADKLHSCVILLRRNEYAPEWPEIWREFTDIYEPNYKMWVDISTTRSTLSILHTYADHAEQGIALQAVSVLLIYAYERMAQERLARSRAGVINKLRLNRNNDMVSNVFMRWQRNVTHKPVRYAIAKVMQDIVEKNSVIRDLTLMGINAGIAELDKLIAELYD